MFASILIILFLFLIASEQSLTVDDLVADDSWLETKSLASRLSPIEEIEKFEDALSSRSNIEDDSENGNDEKDVDCFGLTPVLQRVFRWMFRPQSEDTIDTKFFLTTRENKTRVQIFPYTNTSAVGFNPDRETILIIHGFMSSSTMLWVKEMVEALLHKENVNVITVDWAGGSMSWKYWRAVGNTRVVGRKTTSLLKKLLPDKESWSKLHCIGHSLGAHICSFVASRLQGFGRITGLDPAQPCFSGIGLNSTQANFVDVVHTNSRLLGSLGFGIPHPIGKVDFYPNGGLLQPGCSLRNSSMFSSWFPITRKKLESAICSHGRSYQYFIDSLRSNKCNFWGRLWDFSGKSALNSITKPCTVETCTPMGLEAKTYPGKGAFFLPTLDKTPYCIPDAKTDKLMKGWMKIYHKFEKKTQQLREKIGITKISPKFQYFLY